jgi:hypothetical protein
VVFDRGVRVSNRSRTSRAREDNPTLPPASQPAKERVYSDAEIDAALTKSHGILAVAARSLGCARKTIQERINASPDYWKPRLAEYRESIVDKGENVLLNALEHPDTKIGLDAAKYLLTCLGRARGYTTRTEVTGADGGPIEVSDAREKLAALLTARTE